MISLILNISFVNLLRFLFTKIFLASYQSNSELNFPLEDSNPVFQILHFCRPSINYRGDLTDRFRKANKSSKTSPNKNNNTVKTSPIKSPNNVKSCPNASENTVKSLPVKSGHKSRKLNQSQIRSILWYRYLARWVRWISCLAALQLMIIYTVFCILESVIIRPSNNRRKYIFNFLFFNLCHKRFSFVCEE